MQVCPWTLTCKRRQDSLWCALASLILVARPGAGCLRSAASTSQCKICSATRRGRAMGADYSTTDRWVCGRPPVCHPCAMLYTLGTIWLTQICSCLKTWTAGPFARVCPCMGFSSGELGQSPQGRSYSDLFCQPRYSLGSGYCGQNSCRGACAGSRSASM